MSSHENQDDFEGIPKEFKNHLNTLEKKQRKELLDKLRLYLKEKPRNEIEELFEITRKRIATIEKNTLKKLRGEGSND